MASSSDNDRKPIPFPTRGVERTVIVLMLGFVTIIVFFLVIAGLGTVEDNGLRQKSSGTAANGVTDRTDVVPNPDSSTP